jgi:DNA-binding beta-propeller fold protein YncE
MTTTIFLSVILLTAGLAAVMDFAPDALALKAKGVSNSQFGSATKDKVCGDRLCSEPGAISPYAKKIAAQSSMISTTGPNLLINTDMGKPVLYLINTQTDNMITIELDKDSKWPGGVPLHSIATLDGSKVYLTLMSSETDPLSIIAIKLSNINWNTNSATAKIINVMKIEEPGSKPSMLVPEETDPRQPIVESLWVPGNHQLHGPTILPSGEYAYTTQWTDNKIRVINTATDKLAEVDPIQFGSLTRQIHGIFSNSLGDVGLGTGYYFDMDYITVYDINQANGDLRLAGIIPLTVDEDKKTYGALSHFISWIDDRYAITGTQQLGPTSLTPTGFDVVGPAIFLLDAKTQTAKMIIGPDSPTKPGIIQPSSDIAIVGNKLYVAEEDSMDEKIDEEGYLSIWDITNVDSPKLIKRLGPNNGLPSDFHIGHGLYTTPDGKYIYLQDWASAYLIKIDTSNDKVLKIFDKSDGFIMPHGGYMAGNLR